MKSKHMNGNKLLSIEWGWYENCDVVLCYDDRESYRDWDETI